MEQERMNFIIEKHYSSLRNSEKKAADYILKNQNKIGKMSLDVLAKKSGVSQPTVLRFIRALGYQGYKEFKYVVVTENAKQEQEQAQELQGMYGYQLSAKDAMEEVPVKTIAITIRALENTLKCISPKTFVQAIKTITGARQIDIYGVENSGTPVSDLATKLLYLGLNCRTYGDYYLQRICAGKLSSEDVAIGFSYSGCSRDTVDVMRIAKRRGAKTIVITNIKDSLISKYADITINATHEQFLYGDAIFSRTSQVAIVDMIYMGILLSDYEQYSKQLDRNSRMIRDKAYKIGT